MAVLQRTSFSRDVFCHAAPKFCVLHSGDIVSTYILPMPGMPSYYWLLHTYVTTCHTVKTRRIRPILAVFSWIYNQTGFPGSYSMCRMQRLSLPGGLTLILTVISWIFFQKSANGFRNLREKQRQMIYFDFQGQKVLLWDEFEGPPGLLRKPEVISRFPCSSRAFWVLVGL